MSQDAMYLIHILQAIEKIGSYTVDGKDNFSRDLKTQDAVIRNFEIIGEAVKRIDRSVKDRRPDIPWRQIAGLRDVLIHDYMGVDVVEVWNVVEHHLPALRAAVTFLIANP